MSSHKARSHLPIRLGRRSALKIAKRFVNAPRATFRNISQLSPQNPRMCGRPRPRRQHRPPPRSRAGRMIKQAWSDGATEKPAGDAGTKHKADENGAVIVKPSGSKRRLLILGGVVAWAVTIVAAFLAGMAASGAFDSSPGNPLPAAPPPAPLPLAPPPPPPSPLPASPPASPGVTISFTAAGTVESITPAAKNGIAAAFAAEAGVSASDVVVRCSPSTLATTCSHDQITHSRVWRLAGHCHRSLRQCHG